MLEDFDVAVGCLLASPQSVGETDADLLRDQFRLTEISEAAGSPATALMPADVVLLVAILAGERVDFHGGRTLADDHGTAHSPSVAEGREPFGEADTRAKLIDPALYAGGVATRRYYQDAAILAVFEKLAKEGGTKRALLSLATGAGKTFIAVHLLKRIHDAGQLQKALFVCDRDELRSQSLNAFRNLFGAEAAEVFRDADGRNNARNAKVHIATHQTLDNEHETRRICPSMQVGMLLSPS